MKNMVFLSYKTVVAVALFFCIILGGLNATKAYSSDGLETATLSWVQRSKTGTELFYSQFIGGRWQQAKQLTQTGATNFLPTVAMNGKNESFIVWSSSKGNGFQLNYAIVKNGKVVKEPAQIVTGFISNLGPSLAYDVNRNRMILVWAGSNEEPDDIFMSEYRNNGWSIASRIHPENDVSDYLPKINIDPNGSIKVEWQATLDEGPHEFSTTLHSGTVYKTIPGQLRRLSRQENKAAIKSCIPHLPEGIDDLDDSSIVFKCKEQTPKQVKYPGSYMRKETNSF